MPVLDECLFRHMLAQQLRVIQPLLRLIPFLLPPIQVVAGKARENVLVEMPDILVAGGMLIGKNHLRYGNMSDTRMPAYLPVMRAGACISRGGSDV